MKKIKVNINIKSFLVSFIFFTFFLLKITTVKAADDEMSAYIKASTGAFNNASSSSDYTYAKGGRFASDTTATPGIRIT